MENSYKNNNPVVVAVDIGTTKVCAIAGRRNFFGKLEILAVGKVDTDGTMVMRGVISNIEKTVNAITDAVRMVERQLKKSVNLVHVGIGGQHIKSIPHKGSWIRDNGDMEISSDDVKKLVHDMYKLNLPAGDTILHVIPQEYTIDNEQGIMDPIGMSGAKLEANFQIITGQENVTKNIRKCLDKAQLKMADMTVKPAASADAVLSDEEKEAGIALIDIGGGTTDLVIYHEGIMRYATVIPFGGNAVTKDIREGCNIMLNHAEKLKCNFGFALADEVFDDKVIVIPGLKGRENKEIGQHNLALIIQARMEEILDYVFYEIQKSGYEKKLSGGIVLTGGGSCLSGIDKLTALHSGKEVRIGHPVEHLAHGYRDNVATPMYATVIGLAYTAAMKAKTSEILDEEPEWMRKEHVDFVITNEVQAMEAVATESHRASITETKGNQANQRPQTNLPEANMKSTEEKEKRVGTWTKMKQSITTMFDGLSEDSDLK